MGRRATRASTSLDLRTFRGQCVRWLWVARPSKPAEVVNRWGRVQTRSRRPIRAPYQRIGISVDLYRVLGFAWGDGWVYPRFSLGKRVGLFCLVAAGPPTNLR